MPLIAANRERFEGKRVLDIGTGSGILALYAAQLRAAKVVATDIEPAAIDCTRENARALGLERVVEARLVSAQEPSAYSVIRPGEVFDIILGAPPAEVNRTPVVTSGGLDEGVTSNDTLKLGLSIVDGFREHLAPDGAALLFYPSDLLLPILVSYARHQGYLVEHHPALQLQPADWYALYNTFAVQVARTERVPPGALLLPPVDIALGSLAFGQYRNLDWTHDGRAYSPLWGKDVERLYLGMIVIRKGTGQSGRPPG
jgi:SAM-dependent methyltransferase